jgi:hypothetical protein
VSNFLLGGALDTVDFKITGNTATAVFTATKRTVITSLVITENAGSTPNLTVDRYDTANTTAYFLRNALAVTAKQTVTFNEPMVLKSGWSLRITSSDAAGKFDGMLTYIFPDATAKGNGAF